MLKQHPRGLLRPKQHTSTIMPAAKQWHTLFH